MTPSLSRRGFLGASAATLGVAIAGSGSLEAFARPAAGHTLPAIGYGPLEYKPGNILALPKGFSYKVIAEVGKTVNGFTHAAAPDAMGVFAGPNGGSTLITNHETSTRTPGVPHDEGITYDAGSGANGGTSTIVVDAANQHTEQYASCAGTMTNCAGGETPWNTWLTCEETESKANGGSRLKDHGYVFEVDPTSQAANVGKSNVPLKFLGRYAHEAVAVDPQTYRIYGTEDAGGPNGLFYRWTPPAGFTGGKDKLIELAQSPGGDTAGTFEAMKCFRGTRFIGDLSIADKINTRYQVEWVTVEDRDARQTSIRRQFTDDQVTRSRKLEGMWWADGGAYFVASFARHGDGSVNEHDGQVWFYDPKSESITLKTLFGVNTTPNEEGKNYDGPDNITVSPHGGLILAEDGSGKSHLVGVTAQGKAYPLALNQSSNSEFCGPAFSESGSTLFVNIQSTPGYTLAITGPWGRPSNVHDNS